MENIDALPMLKYSKQVMEHERRNALDTHLDLVKDIREAKNIESINSLEQSIEKLDVPTITRDILLSICANKIESISSFKNDGVDTSTAKKPRVK
jgi:hypothetical protein